MLAGAKKDATSEKGKTPLLDFEVKACGSFCWVCSCLGKG